MKKSDVNEHLRVYFSDTGEATLRILGVASEDDGVYTCVATNELGSVMSSASLRVLGKKIYCINPSAGVIRHTWT